MKTLALILSLGLSVFSMRASAQARVMNPGEAVGQLVFLSEADVLQETPKYKSLSPLSIPVFAELPLDMSVVAGAITLKQQTLLSHVQLKSRARHTPNLDLSGLEGGMSNPQFAAFQDGAWVRLVLSATGQILMEPSTEAAAQAFYARPRNGNIQLRSDMTETRIRPHSELSSDDLVTVGCKAANYAELMKLLNSDARTVVRPGYAIPFSYYQKFIDENPKVKAAIQQILRDPLMSKVAKVSYRENKLKALQTLMMAEDSVVDEALLTELLAKFDTIRSAGQPRKLKLRSSTNSEDLPNFNGAGLYSSESYDPVKKGTELTTEQKKEALKKTLRFVWASVWNLRAFDERAFFGIPHDQVRMGIQVNPSFANEGADGVVVSKNIANDPRFPGAGVYIEVQRGNKYSVTNPVAGVKPQKILVNYDPAQPLNDSAYSVRVIQNSNIGDDNKTVLDHDNPAPVVTDTEAKDLALQVMKAHAHFHARLDATKEDFALDLEFKVDAEDTGARQVYLKQARPYID